MKLAIYFGDNDFAKTFEQVAQVLLKSYRYNNEVPSKELLVHIINNLAVGCAYLFQNRDGNSVNVTMEEYIRIEESKVFLYDEVDEFLKTHCSNQEVVVIDSNLLDYENNSAVYLV